MNQLKRAVSRYLSEPVVILGLKEAVPDVVTINCRSGGPQTALCVYSERHYVAVGGLKTLAAWGISGDRKRLIAKNLFFRLAADYLLQYGAHGDAARFFCTSWLIDLKDCGLSIERRAFDKYIANPVLESEPADGGWPLAHEFGHVMAERSRDEWPSLDRFLETFTPTEQAPALAHRDRERLRGELVADRIGAHLIMDTIAGNEINIAMLIGELVSNSWATFLMEECKYLVGLIQAVKTTDAALEILAEASSSNPWTADLRQTVVLSAILERLPGEAQIKDLMDLAARFFRDQYHAIYAGFYDMFINVLERGLLEAMNAEHAAQVDERYRRWIDASDASSPAFHICAREFVERARRTNNLKCQDASLISYLNISVPAWTPLPALRPLADGDYAT